jgi:hypothetical protein
MLKRIAWTWLILSLAGLALYVAFYAAFHPLYTVLYRTFFKA